MKLSLAAFWVALAAAPALANVVQEENDESPTFDRVIVEEETEEFVDNEIDEDRDLGYYPYDWVKLELTNLSGGQTMSPFFYASHKCNIKLFEFGEPASYALKKLAEDGDPSKLEYKYKHMKKVCDVYTYDYATGPGETAVVTLKVTKPGDDKCRCVSMASMFTTTNDAFVAINAYRVNKFGKSFHPVYDAGTERNSEKCNDVPGYPCDNGHNYNAYGSPEGFVHISPGIGGFVDIPYTYDWNNPGLRMVLSEYEYHY